MNIAVCVICTVFMVLGVTELVRLLVFWWTKPLTGKNFSVVVVPESAEDCECTVRAAAERMRWLDLKGPSRLICVNRANDPEIEKICRFLMLRYPVLRVSKTTDLMYHILEERDRERTD